ncbi:MAG: ribonuclease Y [Patescibacteria group bacterium]|nr:ribonuclease Y [Patescibacteria group bacterium]
MFLSTLIGLIVGLGIGYLVRRYMVKRYAESAEARAMKILEEAKNKEKDFLLAAKEKAIKIIDESKREESERRKEILEIQRRLEKREALFDQKLLEFEDKKQELLNKGEKLEAAKAEIIKIREEQMEKLQKIAGLTKEEAQKILLDNTERDVKEELLSRVRKIQNETQEEWNKEAKHILSAVIERCASSHAAETTTTVITLPSDEMKGRIIGREGRNIKTLETQLGVDIVIDDTPESIIVSGFSPIRRQVAKVALEKLIADGRIHPGRIEEAIEAAKQEIALEIKKAGEDAAYEVGVAGLDPKLIQVLGRLRFRTSYGQNVLQHSVEVAQLSALLAAELGANVNLAKKAGLLHDIGKAVDHEVEGTHPEIGYNILKKFGLPEEVAKVAGEHHLDQPSTLEGLIAKVADAISGARPGARKDSYENYIQRLTELEDTAKTFEGVEKVYAIQAGREVRVFVEPGKIDDWGAQKLAREIANKIEQELKYPGEIKVNVIRETRTIEYAR